MAKIQGSLFLILYNLVNEYNPDIIKKIKNNFSTQ